ncbi:MAG TPA: hypothetical protein VNG33_11595 [Polyangiaceae bacterium]|nr:hypothetical protein [Polyangiaceae bacterium]
MTKRETDFADEDLAMARRALWLLDGNRPGREQPPSDLDLDRLHGCMDSRGFVPYLALFGIIHYQDAIRAAPPKTLLEPQESAMPKVAAAQQRQRMQAEASLDEKRAEEQLREGRARVHNAIEHWLAASDKRAAGYAHAPQHLLNGEHQAVLAELLAAGETLDKVMALMEASRRQVAASSLGLPKAERSLHLNAQARRLAAEGHSLEEIAYVMGWDAGTPAQIRDRTRKRLEYDAE